MQVKPYGGNQEAMASGSPNALNTFSGGAVNTLCRDTEFVDIHVVFVFNNEGLTEKQIGLVLIYVKVERINGNPCCAKTPSLGVDYDKYITFGIINVPLCV